MAVNPALAEPPGATMRLSGTSYAVLSLLELLGAATPYDLKQALEKSIENFWPVPHTTFYAEPDRLTRGGLLSVRQEPAGGRRKLYELTGQGRQALGEWKRSPELAAPQLHDEGVLKIFAGADPLPIARSRAQWHRAKLAELEGYLATVDESEQLRGVRSSLLMGTSYHRLLLDAYEGFLSSQGKPAGSNGSATAAGGAQAATGSS